MYTINQYGQMYTNKARFDAYCGALESVITPRSVVVDLGAGTGIFSLLACKLGARRVYAIEPSDAIHLAQESAKANGFSDRITCIQDLSTEVTLAEMADVIISDLSGQLPLYGHHIPSVIDARERLLAQSGMFITQQDHLRAAVVEATVQFDRLARPWGPDFYGLDLSAGWQLVSNTVCVFGDNPVKLLTDAGTFAVLDYRTITDTGANGELYWTIEKSAVAHGVVVWFDRVIADGIRISNEPGAPESINTSGVYGQAFFPWPDKVALSATDRIHFRIKANLVKDDYIWRWETEVRSEGRVKAQFRQSSLLGTPLTQGSLKKREAGRTPIATEDARIDAFILASIDGQRSLGEISRGVSKTFPMRFKKWQDALPHVAELASHY